MTFSSIPSGFYFTLFSLGETLQHDSELLRSVLEFAVKFPFHSLFASPLSCTFPGAWQIQQCTHRVHTHTYPM